ncbi:exosome RNA helicase MTR4-like [Artemia franciscana]|uniref:Superkiller viralicidic activity 2-like 2 n=1 Tax=Artemia franciscana TaxID=6661 RepID=A0AA88LBC0_ARTSF|nr:hypothetical protein QYM36_000861 [Artemia franciscana]
MADIDDLFNHFDDEGSTLNSSLPELGTNPEELCEKLKRELDEEVDTKSNLKKFKPEDGPAKPEVDDESLLKLGPQIITHSIETAESCTHEVACNPDYPYTPLRDFTGTPAKEYPFKLDPFQQEAIQCIQNSQSVLVSAHTSAGKTVVAEYAIAQSFKENQRVIYTTPIKALSNQKYREFSEEFKDVGIMTGDVTINPSASCLIMTTEILRSMLYRGSEVVREVAWVVFDEIHYMRDKERGVVWEETIILLPDNVRYVFLSATIPNARQFAEWICHLHKQPCHVVYTDYRPTPLQNYVYPNGGSGIYLVVDEKGVFREDQFSEAMSILHNVGDASAGDQRGRKGGMKGGADGASILKIVKMIQDRGFAPVIVFSFSKKECEFYATQMAKLDFNSTEEKKLVEEVFNNAMDVLSDEDKKLPQIVNVLPLLKRGVGIHHGGLLPILKETIEILFSEGLIKALFATETFAMGLNMPARTVLFTNCRKFDGKEQRYITSGEYIQMSGRAGRRGLDDKGIVILMLDEKINPTIGRTLIKGQADQLNSAFHLTYSMVLNLLRVKEINPEYMLERSFFQFQQYANIPRLIQNVRTKTKEYERFVVPREDEISTYHQLKQQFDNLTSEHQKYITKPVYLVPFLQPGRMVYVINKNHDYGWGVVLSYRKDQNSNGNKTDMTGAEEKDSQYIAEILLCVSKIAADKKSIANIKPPGPGEPSEMKAVPCYLHLIQKVSSVRLYVPEDLKPLDNRQSVLKSIREVERRFSNEIPLLDSLKDMKIKEKEYADIRKAIEAFESRLKQHPLYEDKKVEEHYKLYKEKLQIGAELKIAKEELKKAKSLLQMTELKSRKRILRRMGYCTATDVIELKGRVACEIGSGDELLLTELLFNNVFNGLDSIQTASLLSCFVCDEKSNQMPRLVDSLSGPLKQMQDLARRIAKISNDCKLEVQEDEYVEKFKPYLMDVVAAWCKGAPFGDLCQMTDIYEGSIIRCMRRLEELLRQMIQAAKAIGNNDLEIKFTDSIKLIKRDIVFAASLYL